MNLTFVMLLDDPSACDEIKDVIAEFAVIEDLSPEAAFMFTMGIDDENVEALPSGDRDTFIAQQLQSRLLGPLGSRLSQKQLPATVVNVTRGQIWDYAPDNGWEAMLSRPLRR